MKCLPTNFISLVGGLLWVSTFALGQESQPDDTDTQKVWGAKILTNESTTKISGLTFDDSKNLPVSMLPRDQKIRPYVKLTGMFRANGRKLSVLTGENLTEISVNPAGHFEVYALLNSKRSHVDFVATGDQGEPEKERVIVFSPSAQEFRIATNLGEFWMGAGGGSFNYFQTGFGEFASKNVVQKLEYRSPRLYRRFGAKSSFRSPVWTVSSAPIQASPDLLNADLDLYYVGASSVTLPYKSVLSLGVSYFTLLSYGAPFGFSNLFVPSVAFEYHKRRNRYDSYVASARYMPIGGFLSSEYGLDLRVGYRMKLINLHELQVDLSWVKLSYVPIENAIIRARLLSLVASYKF
jgi:hypothetical protein